MKVSGWLETFMVPTVPHTHRQVLAPPPSPYLQLDFLPFWELMVLTAGTLGHPQHPTPPTPSDRLQGHEVSSSPLSSQAEPQGHQQCSSAMNFYAAAMPPYLFTQLLHALQCAAVLGMPRDHYRIYSGPCQRASLMWQMRGERRKGKEREEKILLF